jgi:2-aminoadipate transaminase
MQIRGLNHGGLSELGKRTAPPTISWLMKMALEKPGLISLAAGFTDHASLPVRETSELLEEILAMPKLARATLQYGSTAGDGDLRRMTVERIRKLDGSPAGGVEAHYDPENLLITHGSQQLLYLVTECLCDPGDIVMVEDPTYFVYLSILQSHGVRCRGIPITDQGIDLAGLERRLEELKRAGELHRVKILYLVTYFQNPTGSTTALETKEAALDLLGRYEKSAGHPIYLLEDAAYRELRFAGEEVPSALVIKGAGERVIYTGTYSKPFATGIRTGYGWIPDSLFEVVSRVKGNHDFGTSNLLQQVLVRALSSGKYEAHLPVLQKRYKKKGKVMRESLEANFPPGVRWGTPQGGLYFWAALPGGKKSGPKSALFKRALASEVLYVPGEFCYADDPTRTPGRHEMRLSFGSASEEEIREGIARLGRAMKQGD